MARIKIEDLPIGKDLTQQEMEETVGAGRKGARLGVESLESRDLMASGPSASLTSGVLSIRDPFPGDTIRVRQINNQISVDGTSISVLGNSAASVNAGQVSRIQITPLGGSNLVDLNSGAVPGQQALGVPLSVAAGSGSDNILFAGLGPVTDTQGEQCR